MRRGVALLGLMTACYAVTAAVAATGPDIKAALERAGGGATAGESFLAIASVQSTEPGGGSAYGYSLRVEIPTGLTVVRIRGGGHAGAVSCRQGTADVICTGIAALGPVASHSYILELRASRAGSFTLRNEVTLTDGTDPNPANNTAELSVPVAEAPLGVAGLVRSPTPPRAGRALQATLLLTKGGTPVKAAKTTCHLSFGGRVVPGRASNVATGGRCTWLVPASAKGKQLSGSVTAMAGARSFSRRFAGRAA